MQKSLELSSGSAPLLGICEGARHRFRPVVIARVREGGREEFEILMVCSRCGYTRNARQLQQASEQLASEVMAEIAAGETPGDDSEESDGPVSDNKAETAPVSPTKCRKKVN